MKLLVLPDLTAGSARVNSVAFAAHPDGLRLAVVAGGDTTAPAVRWLTAPDGEEIARRDLTTAAGRAYPTLSPDLETLAYVTADGELALVRQFAKRPLFRAIPEGGINSLAFTPNGDELWASLDSGIPAWNVSRFFTATVNEHGDFEARVGYMSEGGADGRLSAAAGSGMYAMTHADGHLSMYYGGDWSGWVDAPAKAGVVTALAFTNFDGDQLVVAHGKQVGVYRMVYEDRDQDFDEVKRVAKVAPHPGTVTGICMSPDGKSFATSCADGVVRLFEAKKGKEIKAFDWKVGELTAVALSPDGALGAVGTTDGRVLLWDLE